MRTIEEAPIKFCLYKIPFSMALVSPEDVLVHAPTGCRDYLHDIIKAHFNGKKIGLNQYGVNGLYKEGNDAPDVSTDMLRLMISITPKSDPFFENAVKTLNVIEHYANIRPSGYSEVAYVGDKHNEFKHYIVEGSTEYVHNPHLLSALTFILRFIVRNCIAEQIMSAEEFITKIDELNAENEGKQVVFKDFTIANSCRDRLLKVLKNRDAIFKDITLEQFYPKTASSEYHSQGGIACLCKGVSHIAKVNKRVLAL